MSGHQTITVVDLEPGQEHRLAPPPPATTTLERALDSLGPVRRIYVLRQSDENRRRALQTLKADLKADAHLPDVARLRDEYSLEDLVHARGPGVHRVELRHLPGGGSSRQHIGTFLRVGDTLVLMVLSSAAEANLDAGHTEDRGNAFIEALRIAIRRASYQLWQRDPRASLDVRFGDITRLCRDQGHARKAVATMHWAGTSISTREHDNLAATDAIVFDVLLSTAEANLKNTNEKLWKGKDAKLADGGWLGTPPPLTHEYVEVTRRERGRTWTERDNAALAPALTPAQLRDIVETLLRAAGDKPELGRAGIRDGRVQGWDAVARTLARRHDLESRGAQDRSRGGVSLAELDRPGASLRRALGRDYTAAWRSGEYAWVTDIPKHGRVARLAPNQRWVVVAGRKKLETRLPCPLHALPCADDPGCRVDGHLDTDGTHLRAGWGIPDWMWQRLDALVATPGRRGGAKLQRALSGGVIGWTRGAAQYCVKPIGSGHYAILERPVAGAAQRTWKRTDADTRVVVSIDSAVLDTAVGEQLEAAVRDLGSDLAPLSRPDRATASAEEAARRRAERTAELQHQVTQARRAVRRATRSHDGALADLDDAKAAANPEAVAELQVDVDEAAAALRHAQDALTDASRSLAVHDTGAAEVTDAPATHQIVDVDVTHPAALAVLLRREAGKPLPTIVTTRLEEVLDPASHIVFDPLNQRTVDLHLRFRLTTSAGHTITVDRKRTIDRKPNNNRSKSTAGAVANPDDIAKLLLRDGRSVEATGQQLALALGRGDSHTQGFALLARFAATAQLSRTLLHALVDAPAEIRKTVWLLHTGDQAALETHLRDVGADKLWADLIRWTYFRYGVATRGSWALTWLAADHIEDRLVIAALKQAGGRAHPDAIATATGLTVEQVKQTAAVPAPSFQTYVSPKVSHPPAVLKNEWRGRPSSQQWLLLAACPHDCEGFVDTPLWTPETDRPADPARGPGTHHLAGLCSTCRRTPHHDGVFPTIYLSHWSVGHSRAGGQQVDTRTVRTAATTALAA